jgi:hypothetical protein
MENFLAKILINDDWYEELSPTALYETEFENIVAEKAKNIFPEYYIAPFKTKVFTDDDVVMPDLAFIDKDYRGWWVVEVEMNYHSFENHVLPQVAKLSQGYYGKDQADYLYQKNSKDLNKNKLIEMMKGSPPKVLVILNKPMPDWVKILSKFNAKLCVIEVFRSVRNRYVFRINGEYPVFSKELLSDCFFDPLLPRLLVVQSPASLPVSLNKKFNITYKEGISEWERIESVDKVWLFPTGLNPLPKYKKFSILRHDDGSLVIIEKE